MSGGGDSGNEYEVNINLTALLDVLTNLLFFLMVGMAAQQSSIELDVPIELPSSTAELPPKQTLTVTVTETQLLLDKEVVSAVRNGRIGTDTGRIEPLFRSLSVVHGKRVAAGAKANQEGEDTLFVLCDRRVPYALIRRVLTTAAEAGYPKFRMAALMK